MCGVDVEFVCVCVCVTVCFAFLFFLSFCSFLFLQENNSKQKQENGVTGVMFEHEVTIASWQRLDATEIAKKKGA